MSPGIEVAMKTRVVLLNTSILTAYGCFSYRETTLDYARFVAQLAHRSAQSALCDMGPLLSAIGHESTAQVLTSLLGVPVPVNRVQYEQSPDDLAIVFKLRGRPPEGRILTVQEIEAIGFDFGMLKMVSLS